jgi:hypothetical protein
MNDITMMMLALRQFCARHNLEMPTGVEIRFKQEVDAHQFECGLKADLDRDTTTLKPDLTGIDKICGTSLRIAYSDHDGRPVRL